MLVFSGTDRMNKMEIELNFYTHVKNTKRSELWSDYGTNALSDCNDFIKPGILRYNGGYVLNVPLYKSDAYGIILCISSGNYRVQIGFPRLEGVYFRSTYGSSWSDWSEL